MSEVLGTRDGANTPELNRLYHAWANGDVGLCVTGNVMMDLDARDEPGWSSYQPLLSGSPLNGPAKSGVIQPP
ncbi:hypothetical protein [Rhodoferax antarcticus]|uniref:Putative flavin oxidoreductase n=1 Tax=Rhodoferax antarcticus ANT.BR TaxID=1111071 RepID=A0A1Q8YKA2_9BURK|nr:hypothetical protein [Rhodoferax antarcticus]OLP08359.1 putative flavin oxidoreductase [Rhodoferax antarcticus ANT.BR]